MSHRRLDGDEEKASTGITGSQVATSGLMMVTGAVDPVILEISAIVGQED